METKFRQEFQVGNGREFSKDELVLLQILYRRLTVDFTRAPAVDIESKITTACTIEKQTIGSKRLQSETGSGSPQVGTLTVEYTMKYESSYYKMDHYPKMFQTWITENMNVLLVRMQVLGINVHQINIPMSRQTAEHVFRPHRMQVLGIKGNRDNDPTVSSSPSIPSPIALSALTIGISIDRRKRQSKQNDGVDVPMTKRYTLVREHNSTMRPERRTPISKTLRLQDRNKIRI